MSDVELSSTMTMDQAMEAVIAANLDAEALVAGERHITYAQFGEGLNAVAGGLASLGVSTGDRVATILPNSPEYLYFFFGASKSGAVHVPISPLLRENEIAHILAESEAKVVVMVPSAWNNDLLGIVQRLRASSAPSRNDRALERLCARGHDQFDDFMAAGRANPIESISRPEDLYGLIYTSGTTGVPKAVMHSHRTMLAVPILLQRAERAKKPLGETFKMIRTVAKHRERYGKWGREQVTFLTPMPYQALAGYQSMMSAILNGRRLVIIERFHPVLVMRLIQEHHVNTIAVTPTMGRLMLDVPDFDSYDTSSLLTFAFGAALTPPELAEEASEKFNCPVVIGFGATETGGAAAMTKFYDSGANALDSVGRPLPGVEVKLVDESGRTVADGEVGEVVVRTEGNMLGYYKRPEETAEILDADGFLHLGDLAIRDKRGYVRIVGRKKDVIIRGGQNIYPGEVEGVMEQHEQVQQAAVVGVPDAAGRRGYLGLCGARGRQ